VAKWYDGWRGLLPPPLRAQPAVRAALDGALDLCNARLLREGLPAETRRPAAAARAPVAGAAGAAAAAQRAAAAADASAQLGGLADLAALGGYGSAAALGEGVSVLEAIAALAAEADLECAPRAGRRAEPGGQQLFALGPAGGVSFYIDAGKALPFARASAAEPWRPVSLAALVELACAPRAAGAGAGAS
jgi:hypothetical protein